MPNKENLALQHDLFGGEPVDNRTAAQKKAARLNSGPQQQYMFDANEVTSFGSRYKSPYIKNAWHNHLHAPDLQLQIQDVRTPEEIEADQQREAEKLTTPLWELIPSDTDCSLTEADEEVTSIVRPKHHQSLRSGMIYHRSRLHKK